MHNAYLKHTLLPCSVLILPFVDLQIHKICKYVRKYVTVYAENAFNWVVFAPGLFHTDSMAWQ